MLLPIGWMALHPRSFDVYTPDMRCSSSSPVPLARAELQGRRKALRLVAVLPWAMLVAGCGQTGPLYHPPEADEEGEEEEEDQTSALPAALVTRST